MKYVIFLFVTVFLIYSCNKDNSTNPDSNYYPSITIGTQIWMNKNLEMDHYRNGDPIPQIKEGMEWDTLKSGAWCYYNYSDSLGKIYGKLYNWYAVNDPRGLAPQGYHIPTKQEWDKLSLFLGGDSIAGSKMKEIGNSHWTSPNLGATNEFGFSALPAGNLGFINNEFRWIGLVGNWWSSSEYNINTGYSRHLGSDYKNLFDNFERKADFLSIRCIKD